MVLRGVRVIANHVSLPLVRSIANRALGVLGTITSSSHPGFAAQVPRGRSASLPARWSTLPGVYQLKIAAAILAPLGPRSVSENAKTVALARQTRRIQLKQFRRGCVVDELHPAFYALEGLAQLTLRRRSGAIDGLMTRTFSDIMRFITPAGHLPESTQPGAAPRSDVLAQALRIGCVLVERNLLPISLRRTLDQMAAALQDFVAADGSVYFRLPTSTAAVQRNVWSAMFAHQAFTYFDSVANGRRLPDKWVETLV
jgi:hypothetical protein